MAEYSPGRGLDVGTSYIVCAKSEASGEGILYTEFRDAFYRLTPSSPIAGKMMEKGLQGQDYFKDGASFVVVGQDAIERAIERHESANRPLFRGVVSPREREARRILHHILKEILGEPLEKGEKIVYSVPVQPIDQSIEEFDVGYHTDAVNNDLKGLGFTPSPLPEAEAICYSELEEHDYSGLCMSFGAGMVNACLMSSGEPVAHFSTTHSGDYIDRMASIATGQPDTIIQVEKEQGSFQIGKEVPGNSILTAVSLYYVRMIDYTVKYLVRRLSDDTNLPKFTHPVHIIVAGGSSQAEGFVEIFRQKIEENQAEERLPFKIADIQRADEPLHVVARGCLLASQL